MSKAAAIAVYGLRRAVRDWSNLFFLFVFPLILVLVLGMAFGGGFQLRLGVVAPAGDPLADEVVDALRVDEDVDLKTYDSDAELRNAVELGFADGGLIVLDDYSQRLRSGEPASVAFLTGQGGLVALLRPTIEDITRRQAGEIQAARFATEQGVGDFDEMLADARALAESLPPLEVISATPGAVDDDDFAGLRRFDLGASQQLVLFMFVNGIATSAALIQSRQLGVTRRMLATPTSLSTVLAGETLARFALAALQGLYIVGATWLLFDVQWGDPLAALPIVLAFAAVATGVGMVAGALFRNDQQANGVGVFLGIGAAALGGSMVPLEIFTDTMRTVAHITPHAWAYDAFAEVVRQDGSLADVVPEIAVLLAMAAATLSLATWILRRKLTGSPA